MSKLPKWKQAQLDKTSDGELMRRVAAGDHKAFDIVYYKHKIGALNILSRYNMNYETIQDIIQETFLRVFIRAYQYNQGKGTLNNWIITIALNCRVDYLRRNKKYIFHTTTLDQESEDEATIVPQLKLHIDDKLNNLDEIKKVYDIIGQLPEGIRNTIKMYAIDGLDYYEISERLSIPAVTARVRVHRARQLIRDRRESDEQ